MRNWRWLLLVQNWQPAMSDPLPTETMYANCLQGLRLIPGTPAFKARWVKALRSGEFKQARQRLRSTETGFCCMGVALHLIDPNGWRPPRGVQGSMDWRGCDAAEIGTSLRTALQIEGDTARQLADMNDKEKASFAQIANWIETNL